MCKRYIEVRLCDKVCGQKMEVMELIVLGLAHMEYRLVSVCVCLFVDRLVFENKRTL